MPRSFEVVPPNPQWKTAFEYESKQIVVALGANLVAIHHIGSTAIPNIYAKPIIDVLVEVHDITQVNNRHSGMEGLGYVAMGEYGLPGRRYFRKDDPKGVRTHHVHAFAAASSEVKRHLAFCDYLIAHPEVAQQYSDIKRALVTRLDDTDIEGYMDGKDGFIRAMEKRALEWQRL